MSVGVRLASALHSAISPMSLGNTASAPPGQAPSADASETSRTGQTGQTRQTGPPHVWPPSTPDWNNLEVLHRNTLPPRANFFLYDHRDDALSRHVARSKSQLLSGDWLFHLSRSPFQGPVDFHQHEPGGLVSEHGWDGQTIRVPGMWQLQGYGKGPQYTNLNFPFPVDPPRVPVDDNECGRYVTSFDLSPQDKGHQLRLRFEGVDAAFTVWVNHHEVGYSQGSRNPSEFDITPHVRCPGTNHLHVEVYQRCDGTYIEDQVRVLPSSACPRPGADSFCRTSGGSVASSATSGCTSSQQLTLRTSMCRPFWTTPTEMRRCALTSSSTPGLPSL